MNGHIQYVRARLSDVAEKPLSEEIVIALRSMRTMLINGLAVADDHVERSDRLRLIGEIEGHLSDRLRL